ncbi:MAG: hypothetical protein ACOYB3_02040 [Azonexus sp.]
MTETQLPEFDTVQDILDEANAAPYHTILEVWREVLKPARTERTAKITPQWANRIVSTYRGLEFADMVKFRDHYFDKIAELEDILLGEIETDDECLNVTKPEEDVENNSHHYINVLTNWQKTFLSWELDWDCTDDCAAAELAAISEVHRMFFDQNGITALLDQIKFEFSDNDRDLLAAELQELRDSRED